MMTEPFDFSLPKRNENKDQSRSKLLPILMTAVLVCVLINLGFVLIKDAGKNLRTAGAVLSAEEQKQLALKLEKQGLNTASASAWKEYISLASPNNEEAARIWYRIGNLFQTEGQYDRALDSFYRSESFARPEDISSEISRRTQECLEAMGKFAALRHELADRVGMDSTVAHGEQGAKGDIVVAEIGGQKIMKSDLDTGIEHQIERQLSQIAAYLPEDELQKKKEELLKQHSTDRERQLFLNQHILEEVLYRKARESGLADDPDVRASLRDMERSLLAGKVIQKELADEIKITPGDLETYFEAHKQEYVDHEQKRQKTFDEVKNEVFIALRARKEQEVQQKLFARLKEQYDVVIHRSALTGKDQAEKDPAQGSPK